MANSKKKKWGDLSISQQSRLEKEWNRINRTRRKAGQRSYGARGRSAWLRSKGITGGSGGIVRGTQALKSKRRRIGE